MVLAAKTYLKPGQIEPRVYQQVLAAQVLEKGNSLVVAPTALGKTMVAALVANQLLVQKPMQKILFLAPTKPLAMQHQETFWRIMDLPRDQVGLLTGAVLPAKRKKIMEPAVILSATPQVIENDLVNGQFSLANFSLVVFDEAHRAVGDYSYVFLAKRFAKENPDGIILGLTASPGGTSEEIQDVCKNLFIQNIEIKTHADTDVKPHVNEIKTSYEFVQLPESFLQIKGLLHGFQKDQVLFLKKIGVGRHLNAQFLKRSDLLALQSQMRKQIAQNPRQNPALFTGISRLAALLKVAHAQTLVETQGISALNEYFDKMNAESTRSGAPRALKFLLSDARVQKAQKQAKQLASAHTVHPKQTKLLEVLNAQLAKNPESKMIVFNHYRDSVRELVRFIGAHSKRLHPMRFVGQAAKENDPGLSQKEQAAALQQFRNADYNVLVASSVAEEGLDIPSVDLVVFYEPVPSEIRMIQRRGRTGRLQSGQCIVLIAKKTRDEAYYWTSKAKEKRMHVTLREMKKSGNDIVARPKQTTLHKYAPALADKVVVFADHREQASSVVRELVELGVVLQTKQLETGDYVLSDEVCVERKSVSDFLDSMIDGRLFGQLMRMAESYRSPLVIVEGDLDELYSLRNIHKNAIIGALTSIAVNYRVPVLFTRNARETAEFIFVTAKREQLGKEKDLRIRTGRKGLTLREMQQFIIESLPLVGPNMAKSLLRHFKSVRGIVNASEKELQKVDQMGVKKARKIVKLLSAKYRVKD